MVLSTYDFDELVLEDSMNIDAVKWHGERLRADFGAGFGATAVVGPTSGLFGWQLGAGVLPADTDYGNLINSKSRFDYYFDFFQEHTTGDQDVFQIEYRGRKYHASFKEPEAAYQRHTEDLFTPEGLELIQRRVADIYYLEDGSIFDPLDLPGMLTWYRIDNANTDDSIWYDLSGNAQDLSFNGNVTVADDIVNGLPAVRLNVGATNTGFLSRVTGPTVYDVFFLMRMRESTFSNNCGILTGTGGASPQVLVGDDTTTKFTNQSFGAGFVYHLNSTSHLQSDQQAPMDNEWGVVHARYTGWAFNAGFQIGKARTTAGTFAEADICEVIMTGSAALSDTNVTNTINYLKRRAGI